MNVNDSISSVVEYCHGNLLNNKEAFEYLTKGRNLSMDSIKKFQLGLFPQDLRELFSFSDPADLREAGIIKNASKSVFKTWDILIPIKDVYGNFIALSGRTRLTDKEREKRGIPKYINSTYRKSHHLFGLNLAKTQIIQSGTAYVVEGYFDVIMPHQHTLTNFVGVCGKFLSIRQIALLSRYADKIVLILDNEEEAQKCAFKIIEKRQYEDLKLEAKNPLPDGIKDIDQYLTTYSREQLLQNLEAEEAYQNIKTLW